MPVVSTESSIQEDLKAILQAIGLTGIGNADIRVGELPKVGEQLDRVPCVRIAPVNEFKSKPLSFEGGGSWREFQEQVVVIDGSEGDNATDQDKRQRWHEQCATAIDIDPATGFPRCRLAGTASVFHLTVDRAPTFDPAKLAANYAYLPIFVTVHTAE